MDEPASEIEAVDPPEGDNTPWLGLAERLEAGDAEALAAFVDELSAEDQRRAFSRLGAAEGERAIALLGPGSAAHVLEHLPESQAADILEELEPAVAADIIEQLPADVSTDLLQEMGDEDSGAILGELDDAEEAEELRALAAHDPESAGGLMSTSFVAFREGATVAEVLEDFRENAETYADRDVQYSYVLGPGGELRGVLRLRDLVISRRSAKVGDIMIPEPLHVGVGDALTELHKRFEDTRFLGLPAVDEAGVLRGVVSRAAVEEAQAEYSVDDFRVAAGIVGGEELRSMPMLTRCVRRLSWLTPNIALNIAAASVIAMYESTIQSVIALAVFLPIISDMSGCSGNQAVAVSMRELTLGLIRPGEYLRVLWKEGVLGFFNGAVLGILLGTIAALWKGNLWLGAVIGGALMLNTLLSVLLGGLVPLLMKRLKVDPALASGPLLTTCTDMCGFFMVLTLATAVLDRLV